MKVKDILAQMQLENPEANVVVNKDDSGNTKLTVLPLEQTFGDPVNNNPEARETLGAHVDRIEKVRMAAAVFFGLTVRAIINSSEHNEWIELKVKSPTGKTVGSVEITLGYVMRQDKKEWKRDEFDSRQPGTQRFKDYPPDLSGYRCDVRGVRSAGAKLAEALQPLCEAPKWLEIMRDRDE